MNKRPLNAISIFKTGKPEGDTDLVVDYLDNETGEIYIQTRSDFENSSGSNRNSRLSLVLLRRFESGDDMSKFKDENQLRSEIEKMTTDKAVAKQVLVGLITGDGNILSRMASSSPYAVDPIDEVEGLRVVYDKIANTLDGSNESKKTAKQLANDFLKTLK